MKQSWTSVCDFNCIFELFSASGPSHYCARKWELVVRQTGFVGPT